MKPYKILRTFNGSQTGHDFHRFEKGTVAALSDSLAEVVLKEGWVEAAADGSVVSPEKPKVIAETTTETPAPLAEDRETKVTGPEETKPFDITTLDEKQLVKFAKDNFGLKLNAKIGKDALLKAIEDHTADTAAA